MNSCYVLNAKEVRFCWFSEWNKRCSSVSSLEEEWRWVGRIQTRKRKTCPLLCLWGYVSECVCVSKECVSSLNRNLWCLCGYFNMFLCAYSLHVFLGKMLWEHLWEKARWSVLLDKDCRKYSWRTVNLDVCYFSKNEKT